MEDDEAIWHVRRFLKDLIIKGFYVQGDEFGGVYLYTNDGYQVGAVVE